MSKWKGPDQGVKPSCEHTEESNKCLRCKSYRQACILSTGVLKTRGLELARILAEATERSDTVHAAQSAVHLALREKRNAPRLTLEKETAATVVAEATIEQQKREIVALEEKVLALERKVLALECTVVAVDAGGEITKKVTSFLRLLDPRLVEVSEFGN
ncbi:hypothetical protein EV127DRAFT_413645 [Xylaria flabelliformis]|nr:hypothetical protein EV127DRAFT_413645 [Xylaria flabelliformis]